VGLVLMDSSAPTGRLSGVGRTIGVVVMLVAFLGCAEAVRDVEGAGAKELLDQRTVAELEAVGVEIAGELDCSSDVDDNDAIVGTCAGSATDGRSILTTLDGTIEGGQCSARITISVADDVVYDESGIDCLSGPEQ
jgi:hypothetical protein